MNKIIMILVIFAGSILLSSSVAFAEFEVEYEEDGRKILIDKNYYMSENKIREFIDLDAAFGIEDEIDLFIEIKKPEMDDDGDDYDSDDDDRNTREDGDESFFKVKIQIDDACVKGSTADEAKMKLGFTTFVARSDRVWLSDEFIVENKFFSSKKSSDPNKRIDLVFLEKGKVPIPFPEDPNGDDLIQQDGKKKSFKHKSELKKIDKQSGWKGKFTFTGPPGDYFMFLIFPAEGTVIEPFCDNIAAVGFHIFVPESGFVRNLRVG